MPDKDRFQRSFAQGWKKVYRLARDGTASDEELSAACVSAVAKSLRETRGCPGFNEIAQIVNDAEFERRIQPLFFAGGAVNLSKTLESIRKVEEQFKHNRITKLAARAAISMLAKEQVTKKGSEIRQNLAEKICLEVVDHHFFGRGRNYLVEHRFGTISEERKWENGVKEQLKVPISKLAANLIKAPNSSKIQSPRRKGIRRPTKELLYEPLISSYRGKGK